MGIAKIRQEWSDQNTIANAHRAEDKAQIEANFQATMKERKARRSEIFQREMQQVADQIDRLEGNHFEKFAPAGYLFVKRSVEQARNLFATRTIEKGEKATRL
ncbi:hypothetical protein [Sulfitobacter sp. JB4-11]|uniref:hypothetical protein n=1 Tax=Sulfitobacter rhodophyticola TaxID=3238304 RepID=UPI003D814D20